MGDNKCIWYMVMMVKTREGEKSSDKMNNSRESFISLFHLGFLSMVTIINHFHVIFTFQGKIVQSLVIRSHYFVNDIKTMLIMTKEMEKIESESWWWRRVPDDHYDESNESKMETWIFEYHHDQNVIQFPGFQE